MPDWELSDSDSSSSSSSSASVPVAPPRRQRGRPRKDVVVPALAGAVPAAVQPDPQPEHAESARIGIGDLIRPVGGGVYALGRVMGEEKHTLLDDEKAAGVS